MNNNNVVNNGGVVNLGNINGNVGDITVNNISRDTMDWNQLEKELRILSLHNLPPQVGYFTYGMQEACEQHNQSKAIEICKKCGNAVLSFVKELGLEFIASLIVSCIL